MTFLMTLGNTTAVGCWTRVEKRWYIYARLSQQRSCLDYEVRDEMTHDNDNLYPSSSEHLSEETDSVDEELLALPGPPIDFRFVFITGLVLVLSVAMLAWFYPDMQYLLRGLEEPTQLGEAADIDATTLDHNSYVVVDGIPWVNRTVVFQESRKMFALSDNTAKMFPLMGQSKVLVQWKVPTKYKAYRDPNVDPTRLALPTHFKGRLVRKEFLGKGYNRIWEFFLKKFKFEVDESNWIVIDGTRPSDKFWVIPVYLIFLTMIAVNLLKLRRFWLAWRA